MEQIKGEIAKINRKIDQVEEKIEYLNKLMIKDPHQWSGEENILYVDRKNIREKVLLTLQEEKSRRQEEKSQLRQKESQLRELLLLEKRSLLAEIGNSFFFTDCKIMCFIETIHP